jgi:hypothetical protein
MRIITKTVATLLVAVILLISTGCTQAQLNEAKEQYNPDYKIGVIKSTEAKHSSYIEYYDEDLNLVNAIWYPYAQLNTNYSSPPAQDDKFLYLVPCGLMGIESDRKVISLDLQNGTVREYYLNLPSISDLAIDKDYIYARNNMNYIGTVARIDIATGETKTVELGTVPSFMLTSNNRLYVSWWDAGDADFYASDDDRDYISCLTQELETLNTIGISEVGARTVGVASDIFNDFFYVALTFGDHNKGEKENHYIYSYSLATNSLKLVAECANLPIGIVPHENSIITINEFIIDSSIKPDSGFIDIYDKTDGTLLNSVSLDYSPAQAIVDGDNLYVQGFDCLIKYHISGSTITELKRVDIPRIGSPADTSFHYLAGMFKKG